VALQQPEEVTRALQRNAHLAQHIVLDGCRHNAFNAGADHFHTAVLTELRHGQQEAATLLLHASVHRILAHRGEDDVDSPECADFPHNFADTTGASPADAVAAAACEEQESRQRSVLEEAVILEALHRAQCE
jgi:hypothetical protein